MLINWKRSRSGEEGEALPELTRIAQRFIEEKDRREKTTTIKASLDGKAEGLDGSEDAISGYCGARP